MNNTKRTRAARAVTVLAVAAALLPAAVGGAAGQEDELSDVRRQLDDARRGLEDIEGRQALGLADLERSEIRTAELTGQLVALEAELATAEEALRVAEAELAATTAELVVTQDRLGAARVELSELRAGFRARARATYIYGGGAADTPGRILEARDVAELQRAMTYVQEVLDEDRLDVENADVLERQIAVDADALGTLQDQQTALRVAAEAERDRVGGLVEQQRDLTAQAEAEVERHRLILAQLESDEASARQLIDNLQAESGRLEDELAARARAARSSGGGGAPPASSGQLQRPVDARAGSPFGYRVHPISGVRKLHAGIDFGAPTGTPIYAADDGRVLSAGVRGGYGNATVIEHGGGLATLYAHQSRFAVRAGQTVSRGEVIGYVGSTGYSTGPHLHFETRVNGTPVDPAGYL